MRGLNRPLVFLLFFVSGFCGLLYQVVWTRLAFASFGIITPVLSVVISVFMLGLSLGSWAGGRSIGALVRRTGLSAGHRRIPRPPHRLPDEGTVPDGSETGRGTH